MDVSLARHFDSSGDAAAAVRATIGREAGDVLALTYSIEGDVARIRVPPVSKPQVGERLWEHTCCELFLSRKGETRYYEFNFSPSGEWAAFEFERYREGTPLAGAKRLKPQISLRRENDKLQLAVVVHLERVSPHLAGKLSIGLSAIVEEDEGRLSYWALRHAPGKPDFHHPDAFALGLDEIRH